MAKRKKKKPYETVSIPELFASGATALYVILMAVVFPMFYRENILHLIYNKRSFFLIVSIIYLICLCPAWTGRLVKAAHEKKKPVLTVDTVFTVSLFAAVLLSLLMSSDRAASWNGISYRTVPADIWILCILTGIGVRCFGKFNSQTLMAWLAGSVLIYICGILCACKINFLWMQDGLSAPDIFLTPLGNTNFNASYVSLVLPLVLVMYMICRENSSRVMYAVVMYLGFLFTFFIKTESSVLALAGAFFLLYWFAVEEKVWFSRYIEMILLFVLSLVTIRILLFLMPDQLYPFDGLDAILLKGWTVAGITVVGLALYLTGYVCKDRFRQCLLRCKKPMMLICALLFGVALVTVISVNVIPGWRDGALSVLVLTDDSFSNRGILWKNTVKLMKQASPLQWLFGHGLNRYGESIRPLCYDEILARFGFLIKDPHNEFLQTLTDMGILGVVSWFGLLLASLVRALRHWKENPFFIVVFLSVSVYLIQGLVNCYALTHLPLVFLFLGLAQGDLARTGFVQK